MTSLGGGAGHRRGGPMNIRARGYPVTSRGEGRGMRGLCEKVDRSEWTTYMDSDYTHGAHSDEVANQRPPCDLTPPTRST